MQSISIQASYYSDTGYRFRKNTFDAIDQWAPVPMFGHSHKTFYDIKTFNSDTMEVGEEINLGIMKIGQNYKFLAEMYFRLDNDEIFHSRVVYQFMDFLGDVGGVVEVLSSTAVFLIGGYLAWHQAIETMISLYSECSPHRQLLKKGSVNEKLDQLRDY